LTAASPRPQRDSRLADATWAIVVVGAAAFYVSVGRRWWFLLDDWDFLASRQATSAADLLRPHNEHWSTLPILVYRAVFSLVHLHSYRPYQAIVIGLHLAAATLLRVVMRRAGADPWIATAAAAAFALLGSGNENILWAFQIGFVGSLVLGLGQLLLATGDGPRLSPRRRQGLAAACGLGAVMSSGVGVTMVGVAALACALRRRWWDAAVQAGVPGLCFAVWWLAEGRRAYEASSWTPGGVAEFVRTGLGSTLSALGQADVVGAALVAVLVAGAVLAVRESRSAAAAAARLAGPLALLVGVVVFFTINGIGRESFGPGFARAPRYLHLGSAMLLPAIAVAASAIGRRWAPAGLAAGLLLLVGVPGNLDEARNSILPLLSERRFVLALPRDELAARVPPDLAPGDLAAQGVTIGWLRQAADAGEMPRPLALSPEDEAGVTLRLSLYAREGEPASGGRACRAVTGAIEVDLAEGDRFGVLGGVRVTAIGDDGLAATPISYILTASPVLEVLNGPLRLQFTEVAHALPARVCLAPSAVVGPP
jgi:hypothetical protein